MRALRTTSRLLLGVLSFGLAGTLVELLLMAHYEDAWQVVPLVLVGVVLAVLVWHAATPNGVNLRALQILMVLVMAVGVLGVALHFDGAAEFQREIDPAQDRWTLISKVIRAKAPPVLAPGLMSQLGLLGLIYVYCRQAAGLADRPSSGRSDTV